MIIYREIPSCDADLYDNIEMKVLVTEIYEVIARDLEGISFEKRSVIPYWKDFTIWDKYANWKRQFNISNWYFVVAFDDSVPVGGAVLCHHTPKLDMLDGRSDLGVLWDIRVDSKYKRTGIGQHLFDLIREKAKALHLRQLKIECQNVNIPAVNFYFKQGAHLGAVNRYAYFREKSVADEVQLLLYLDL